MVNFDEFLKCDILCNFQILCICTKVYDSALRRQIWHEACFRVRPSRIPECMTKTHLHFEGILKATKKKMEPLKTGHNSSLIEASNVPCGACVPILASEPFLSCLMPCLNVFALLQIVLNMRQQHTRFWARTTSLLQ